MEWRADHVTFRAWNGWSAIPAPADIIDEWTYTGGNIPLPGSRKDEDLELARMPLLVSISVPHKAQ